MFALRRRAIGVSAALIAAASLTASLLISTALAQSPPDPSISSIVVTNIAANSATVTVNVADDDADGTTVYLKYSPETPYPRATIPRPSAYNVGGERHGEIFPDAPPLSATSDAGVAVFALPASALPAADLPDGEGTLWAAFDFIVEASLDVTFASDVVTETFRTLDPEVGGRFGNPTQTSLKIHGSLSSVSGTPIVIHYRYREESSSTWVTGSLTIPWRNQNYDEIPIVTGLTPNTPYVIEVSSDPAFPPDKTTSSTEWTLPVPPDLVRMGVRKVTDTEATITAIMGNQTGRDYYLECQSRLDDPAAQWSPSGNPSLMDGYVGEVLQSALTVTTDYEYQCRLEFHFDPDVSETEWVFATPKYLRTLGTNLDLTEIYGSIADTSADIYVGVANPDGAYQDVYLRHRDYPAAAWTDVSAFPADSTLARFPIENLTNDAVHEFQASLNPNFLQEVTLTLFLPVGNPSYSPVTGTPPEETTTPPEETTTPTEETNNPPVDDNQNNENQNTNNGGGTLPQNNGGGGGGGGFASSPQTRNTAPKFRDSAGDVRTVPENSEEGVKVGKPILAWDPENDVLAFSLRGDDAEPFTIDEKTGQILVGKDAVLDYEAQKVHVVTLVVTDPGDEETTTELEIHLTDVKLPGKADIFDVANNHNERLEKEEVEAAAATYGLGLITKLEILFIVKYYYDTELGAIDFENLPSMVDKYDLNEDSIIDRDEVLTALQDFMEGKLSKADMREIVEVYYTTIEEEAQVAEPAQT